MGWWARYRGRELPAREHPPKAPEPGATRDGAKHGVWIEEGESKSKLVESIYRDGVRRGPFRLWHTDGWLMERGTFVDGERDGDLEMLDKAGRVRVVAPFRAGKQHGMCRAFEEDGSIRYEREYRDGQMWSGPYDLKSSHGDHYSWRKAYKDGHPIGAWEENDYKGRPQWRRTYDDDGTLHGPWSTHHEGGTPKLEGTYERGERTGVWRCRDKSGAEIALADFGGDRIWRADGAAIDPIDDDDLDRWVALAAAWRAFADPKRRGHWFSVEHAVDAWPDGAHLRACAWVAARIEAHGGPTPVRTTVGPGWLSHLVGADDDPRGALIEGISCDHLGFTAENMARIARAAPRLRALSLDEVDLAVPADAMFPDGVAWPVLERLSVYECGRLGALVSRLAAAPWAGALTHLTLDDDADAIRDADAAALISSPHLTALRDLFLGAIAVGPRLVPAIATSPLLAHVEELELRYPGDALAVLAALAARDTPALRELRIRGEGDVPRNTLIGLVAKARHPKLERLELEDFDVPDGIADELARRWPNVRVSF